MPELPTGTVTFLFTDIEGSTRLWEEHPDAMRLALARHDALLRAAIETNGGSVFKTVGDQFCAAFAAASDAVDAALAIQQHLRTAQASTLQQQHRFQVRIALHTGAAELRDGDYFGPPLNRVARLLATAHGGQVLLSAATQELAQDDLPSGAALRDLGQHRLRDLQRPEHVFQLLHPDLPAEFPPLRSLAAFPHNLPVQVTSFVGREQELRELKALLEKTRLLTLTGAGGCGKSRLSLQLAAEVLETYPDGVWLVELAPLSDPALVPQAVAAVLGVREEPGRPLTQTLLDYLKTKHLLLLLDNCEHLLAACAELAHTLVRGCPQVQLLVTSREALGIGGELSYRVPSLSLPDPRHLPPVERLTQYEAVKLFIERSTFSQPSFAVTNQNAPAVAQVCYRLDGIPLAIELAAARVKALPVEKLNERLEDRFRLLTGGSRTALPRQQTLRATIDWSYDLLSEPERVLLRRLAVFAGGWTLEAAEAVCAGQPIEEWAVLDLLTSLVEKSLVIYEEQDARYRLLETVRQYARDRLLESAEGEAVRGRHLDYVLTLAEEAEPHLTGAEQTAWLERLETEHDNLRAAHEWSGKQEAEGALRLAGALWRFWWVRGYLGEGRERLEAALQEAERRAELRSSRTRAKALNGAGALASIQGDYTAARSLFEESLAITRERQDKRGIAASLNNLGNVAYEQGDYTTARSLYEESLAIWRELEHKGGFADSLGNLGNVAYEQGDYRAARAHYEESLAIYRQLEDHVAIALSLHQLGNNAYEQGDYRAARSLHQESLAIQRGLGDQWGIAHSLNSLGSVACCQGDYTTARSLYEQSLAIRRELGDMKGVAASLNNLGCVAYKQGDYTTARSLYEESLVIYRELGDRRGIAASLEGFAEMASAQGRVWERAGRLWGAAAALREAIGAPLAPSERAEYERGVGAARAALGEEAFAAAWTEGRAMTLEQAIAYALKEDPAMGATE